MWTVTLENNSKIKEVDASWSEIKNSVKITGMEFKYRDMIYSFPDNQPEYICSKTASAALSFSPVEVSRIESRNVGWKGPDGNEVLFRFCVHENKIDIETSGKSVISMNYLSDNRVKIRTN